MGKHGGVDCSMCNGTGKVTVSRDGTQEERPCSGCRGTGKV
ncbi:DnaJ-class molecular chaperone [Nocardiopsis mwathae]|uniref:DnaJ-class molecular chaperone n=1 Tax=Nocardiopsis mwathae TaxID=1472723 RepID=A0A7W9YII0_9ACTN|nr:DnaJ-class molecular chaperone [Nocardiopsis mwathae]